MSKGFQVIFAEHGVLGLWRGMTAAVTRVMVGSAVQLSTFSTAKEYIITLKVNNNIDQEKRRSFKIKFSYISTKPYFVVLITKTCLYNVNPLKPHYYITILGFIGVYIIFLISVQKHRLWVLIRTASLRQF